MLKLGIFQLLMCILRNIEARAKQLERYRALGQEYWALPLPSGHNQHPPAQLPHCPSLYSRCSCASCFKSSHKDSMTII